MFIGKPLLPAHLVKHEFKIYLLVLFLSRLLIPLIIIDIANGFMFWLHNIAVMMQYRGITDVWTPYPLFMNFYVYFLYSVASGDYIAFSMAFFVFNALADIVNGVVIWKILEKSSFKYTPIMRWLYAYSPLAIIWVSLQIVFEPYIVMLMMLSIYFLKLKKISLSSYFASVGGSLKIFPILAVFSFLLARKSKRLFLYSLFLILFFNGVLLSTTSVYFSGIFWQMSRPEWGSLFSLANIVLGNYFLNLQHFKDFLVNEQGMELIEYGIVGITPDPIILQTFIPLHLSVLKVISLLLILIAIIIFSYFSRKRNLELEKILLGILSLFFVFSFGFSPQYILYIFVLLFIVFKGKDFLLLIILFQIIAILEYPLVNLLYFFNFISLNETIILFYSVVLVRCCLLVYISLTILRNNI